jgi:hypothetical protein
MADLTYKYPYVHVAVTTWNGATERTAEDVAVALDSAAADHGSVVV